MNELSHIDNNGKANMVDVSNKTNQKRTAVAEGFISLATETLDIVKKNLVKKGDVISIAEIAGIMAAKRTPELIPLCHNLNLTKVDVKAEIQDDGIKVISSVACIGQTGVEMEALTAVSISLLTIYDMCKAVDKTMIIKEIKLLNKQKEDL
ncbi:MAG: cyclic pyranopterin monophosphate synthase MoaC [Bacteroidales bacterium]|jgi:cyclic pyranopterin phosphate synthase|nr:cyclic pyranopterin monophosphate synthase MoaC [Bacteroidales bacterium]HOL98386.1 cyclic pyranopterin monophosphate synthase MoaC [Bacteroidales bacterium]HOM37279.1 cyclic pyranopterin monophosphate synthase MoaC [Bacteroidales bacterium]HPD24842.1 cyclic pyranopterin monophosphate synthase MoaC [Bacteroidales bacterium]HRS99556.1 cyclic pyranopterin monophosphate synthase MoaC [Bacteroidales bacterium]